MTDLHALALAKSIRFAAGVIGICMILLGLMIWQPWAKPQYKEAEDYRGKTTCIAYKGEISCPSGR